MSRDYLNRKIYNREYNKKYYVLNKDKVQHARKLRKYQITDEEHRAFLTAQNNRCAICFCEEPRLGRAIDHCHATGRVRGILCVRCNLMIGFARDNVETLRQALVYLSK